VRNETVKQKREKRRLAADIDAADKMANPTISEDPKSKDERAAQSTDGRYGGRRTKHRRKKSKRRKKTRKYEQIK
jgi:hypothetical protein